MKQKRTNNQFSIINYSRYKESGCKERTIANGYFLILCAEKQIIQQFPDFLKAGYIIIGTEIDKDYKSFFIVYKRVFVVFACW